MSQPAPSLPANPRQAGNARGDRHRVVVVGGGLAGLTCALDLAEACVATTLIERRPFAGGKTFSFTDPDSGVELDNGQHIYLRCCTAYVELIERLGLSAEMHMQPHLQVPVLDPATGVVSPIASSDSWPARVLPAPLNLAASILRFRHLGLRDKLMLGRAVLPLMRMNDPFRTTSAGGRDLDNESFGDWLRAHGQSARVIERFWDLIVLPTCNDVSDAVSAAQAAYVFKTGLLDDAHGADIGMARVGLSRVADAMLDRFRAAGGQVRLGRSVRGILAHEDGRLGLALAGGEPDPASAPGTPAPTRPGLRADAIVLALPPNRAAALLPPAWRDQDALAALDAFQYSPIVNVHLHYARPVMDQDFVAVLDPAVQYVFNRSRIRHPESNPDASNSSARNSEADGSQWLDVSLSGAHTQAAQPQADIADAAIAGLRRAFPKARISEVRRWRVVKELQATFRPSPGIAARRPGPTTGVRNLFLAGAWTDTQWPATMESAVRSGHTAAAACRRGLAP